MTKQKICTRCGTEKVLTDFVKKYDGTGRYRGYCKDCWNKKRTARNKIRAAARGCRTCGGIREYGKTYCPSCLKKRDTSGRSEAWKKMVGGKCIRCGYDRCLAALDFHHRDPSTKQGQPSKLISKYNPVTAYPESIAKVKAEIAKCDLVCANCHREIHHLA